MTTKRFRLGIVIACAFIILGAPIGCGIALDHLHGWSAAGVAFSLFWIWQGALRAIDRT